MSTIGVAMIVGGMALLFSGLIFLLPTERKLPSSNESIEENQERIEYYLTQIRKHRVPPVDSIASEQNSGLPRRPHSKRP